MKLEVDFEPAVCRKKETRDEILISSTARWNKMDSGQETKGQRQEKDRAMTIAKSVHVCLQELLQSQRPSSFLPPSKATSSFSQFSRSQVRESANVVNL